MPSAAFEEFLQLLGTRIQLKDWAGYRGGLDVQSTYTHRVWWLPKPLPDTSTERHCALEGSFFYSVQTARLVKSLYLLPGEAWTSCSMSPLCCRLIASTLNRYPPTGNGHATTMSATLMSLTCRRPVRPRVAFQIARKRHIGNV